MVYPSPQASRDIASLAIWSSHKVAASFGSQQRGSIGGPMTGAIWNAYEGNGTDLKINLFDTPIHGENWF
jgi:hypothetical protein